MARKRVPIGFPSNGIVETAPFERQPQGTTPGPMRNVRPRDWADGGAVRGAQRPTLGKFGKVADTGTIRGMASAQTTTNFADSFVKAQIFVDDFDNRTTASGSLGDWDLTGGNDYTIVTHATGAATNSRFRIDAAQKYGSAEWTGTYSSGAAIKISASGKVVDDFANASNTGIVALDTRICAAYWTPSEVAIQNLTPTDNFTIRVKARLRSDLTSSTYGSFVGLFCCGDSATALTANDEAFFFGLSFRHNGASTYQYHPVAGINSPNASSTSFNIKTPGDNNFPTATIDNDMGDGDTTDRIAAADSGTDVILEMRKAGQRCEFWLTRTRDGSTDTERVFFMEDITTQKDGDASTVNLSQTEFGFLIANVGIPQASATLDGPVEYVSQFEVLGLEISPAKTLHPVAVSLDGDIHVWDKTSKFEAATNGTDALEDNAFPFMVAGPSVSAASSSGTQYIYCGDGKNYKKVDVNNKSVSAWTASPGSLPADNIDTTQKARYGASWDKRIMLWGVIGAADQLYLSKQGDWDDWDTTPTDTDGTEAVTMRLDEPIACARALTEDVCALMAFRGLWLLHGNPASGGRLLELTPTVGAVGPFAATPDGRGGLFIVDATGVFRLTLDGGLEPWTLGKYEKYFDNIDYDKVDIIAQWSERYQGLHIIKRSATTQDHTHLWLDAATKAVIEDTFPKHMSPTCLVQHFDAVDGDRLLVGCWDGRVRLFDSAGLTDDGTAVDAVVRLTPIGSDGTQRAVLEEMEVILADKTHEIDWAFIRADTLKQLNNDPTSMGTIAGNVTLRRPKRMVAGPVVAAQIWNKKKTRFALEHVKLIAGDGGMAHGAIR